MCRGRSGRGENASMWSVPAYCTPRQDAVDPGPGRNQGHVQRTIDVLSCALQRKTKPTTSDREGSTGRCRSLPQPRPGPVLTTHPLFAADTRAPRNSEGRYGLVLRV